MLLEPESADGAARFVGDAARAGRRIVIRGGGTKSDRYPLAPVSDDVLSTLRLNRVVAHRHGDLTATIEAGAPLDAVNRRLAEHGQWLALDPPWEERATIGGIVATNDSGPRRHRYGSPRDQIIGVEIARADGVRAKAGGIVVKNVAGYDLARLMTGSYGCLGVVLSATFKLYPIAPSSKTVVADAPSAAAAGNLAAAVNASQLTPTAVEIQRASSDTAGARTTQQSSFRLLIRFESTAASTAAQSAAAAALAQSCGARARAIDGDDERGEWDAHRSRPWNGSGAVARVTLLPANLTPALDAIASASIDGGCDLIGRAGLGVLLVRLDGDASSQASAISSLRAAVLPLGGTVAVLRASPELAAAVDAWGPMGDAFRVMQSVKRAFDPGGVLNPGRGPGGL